MIPGDGWDKAIADGSIGMPQPSQAIQLTASEAKKLTLAAHDLDGSYKREATDLILKGICAAAKRGESEYKVTGIDAVVKKRLEKLGYVVTVKYDYEGECSARILWS